MFKVQANMDPAHRDRIAFLRVCSGRFERGMVAVHAASGRPFTTKYARATFGQHRSTIDLAYPGDVVGLVNAAALQVGDTLYLDEPVTYPPIPNFAPEHFAVARVSDTGRSKQFRRGIGQLAEEGVVQVLRSDRRGDASPVLAAVGPMQFDVTVARLAQEFGAPVAVEQLPYSVARRTDAVSAVEVDGLPGVEVFTRAGDGTLLALVTNKWRLAGIEHSHPQLTLEALVADAG